MIHKKKINTSPKISLTMPVLNEGQRIIPVISTLAYTSNYPLEIIMVYDDENDSTIKVVKSLQNYFSNIRLIKNEGERVIGAIKTGFKHSRSDIVGIWTSYHVDPYGLINKMYDKIENEGCIIVSGNRFNRIKRISRGHILKKFLSRLGNYALNRIIGVPIGDITTSLKLYKKTFIDSNQISTSIDGGWAMSTELIVKGAIKGIKMGEVEFLPENINLIHGISNFKVFVNFNSYLFWLYHGFKNRKLIKNNYKTLI